MAVSVMLETGCSKYTNGKTDFGKEAYGGPMPPNGHGRHNYYFWVLAYFLAGVAAGNVDHLSRRELENGHGGRCFESARE